MKKTVYLIRHGETDDNLRHVYQGVSQDNSLNETGKIQARLLGQWLRDRYPMPEAIFTSPANRAMLTAICIQAEIRDKLPFGLNVRILDKLHETNHGDWEGKSDDTVRCEYPELYKLWHEKPHLVRFPNGESMREAKNRILKTFKDDVLECKEKIIMVVTHAGVLYQIINHVYGARILRGTFLDNSCLNIVKEDDYGKLRMQLTNGTDHLPKT